MSRRAVLILAVILVSVAGRAQTYSGVQGRNFWNSGPNAVGIRQDTVSISFAEAFGSFVKGDLKAASEAASAWRFGVRAASIKHLSKFSMDGRFSFEQMEGKDMAGSMFIRPDFYPINVYEFTKGPKTLQTYSFSGGLSVDIAPMWRIGGRVDFESSNYAKRKDLRHTNYRLDFSASPGVMYHNGIFAVGFNYIFSKNSETVNAEQVGNTVSAYEAFFDKGLYYGIREVWTGGGVHLNEAGVSGLPVSETIHGASLQLSCGPAYADVTFRTRYGFAGEKQVVWYRFPGWDFASHAGLRLKSGSAVHTLQFSLNFLYQDNYETVLEKVTRGGVTTTEEHGSNLIFSRNKLDAAFTYICSFHRWRIGAVIHYGERNGRVSTIYPYVMRQSLSMPSFEGTGSVDVGNFTLGLRAMTGCGVMLDYTDVFEASSGVAVAPERLESYYVRYREHLTCPRLIITPSVRWNMGSGLYLDALMRYDKGFNIHYLAGDYRVTAEVRFGYNF